MFSDLREAIADAVAPLMIGLFWVLTAVSGGVSFIGADLSDWAGNRLRAWRKRAERVREGR